jgi:hypothetical protein
MKTYTARFYGRLKGALGVSYWIETQVEVDAIETARIKLYDRYEHISHLTLTDESVPAHVREVIHV